MVASLTKAPCEHVSMKNYKPVSICDSTATPDRIFVQDVFKDYRLKFQMFTHRFRLFQTSCKQSKLNLNLNLQCSPSFVAHGHGSG